MSITKWEYTHSSIFWKYVCMSLFFLWVFHMHAYVCVHISFGTSMDVVTAESPEQLLLPWILFHQLFMEDKPSSCQWVRRSLRIIIPQEWSTGHSCAFWGSSVGWLIMFASLKQWHVGRFLAGEPLTLFKLVHCTCISLYLDNCTLVGTCLVSGICFKF